MAARPLISQFGAGYRSPCGVSVVHNASNGQTTRLLLLGCSDCLTIFRGLSACLDRQELFLLTIQDRTVQSLMDDLDT